MIGEACRGSVPSRRIASALVDVADPRRDLGSGELRTSVWREAPRGSASRCGGNRAPLEESRWSRKPSSLEASPTIAASPRRPRAGPRRRRDRLAPAGLAAAFRKRGPVDALLGAEHLEAVAPAVTEPAVIDLGVVAAEHPCDLLVANGEADVALARAERADRARLLDIPGPGAEAVGVVGQRADRAELGDVAMEGRDVGTVVEGADVGAIAALQKLQLLSPRQTSWLKRTQR